MYSVFLKQSIFICLITSSIASSDINSLENSLSILSDIAAILVRSKGMTAFGKRVHKYF